MTEISSAQMREISNSLHTLTIPELAVRDALRSAADQIDHLKQDDELREREIDAKNARIKALEKALETIAACRGSDARAEMGFMLGVAQQALTATDVKAGV